jgi:hypothetical protein
MESVGGLPDFRVVDNGFQSPVCPVRLPTTVNRATYTGGTPSWHPPRYAGPPPPLRLLTVFFCSGSTASPSPRYIWSLVQPQLAAYIQKESGQSGNSALLWIPKYPSQAASRRNVERGTESSSTRFYCSREHICWQTQMAPRRRLFVTTFHLLRGYYFLTHLPLQRHNGQSLDSSCRPPPPGFTSPRRVRCSLCYRQNGHSLACLRRPCSKGTRKRCCA